MCGIERMVTTSVALPRTGLSTSLMIDSIFAAAPSQRTAANSSNSPKGQIELRHRVKLVDLHRQIDVILLPDFDQIPAAAALAQGDPERPIGQQPNGRPPGIDRD